MSYTALIDYSSKSTERRAVQDRTMMYKLKKYNLL